MSIWNFFQSTQDEITFCEKCKKCVRDCKQSYRATIIDCPRFTTKKTELDVKKRNCVVCGMEFEQNGRKIYCSKKCEHIGNKNKSKERMKKKRNGIAENVTK